MQRAAIVSGVLGLGSVLVFAAAALAAALFPNGSTVSPGFNAWQTNGGGFGKGGIVAPAPAPAIEPGVIDDGKDELVPIPDPLPDQ
jgi:hypothetical protein